MSRLGAQPGSTRFALAARAGLTAAWVAIAGAGCEPVGGDAIICPAPCPRPTTGPEKSWIDYVSELPLPQCPTPASEVLVVDDLAWAMDAPTTLASRAEAGARLSLPEALWIARNRPGPDTIRFDPETFRTSAPGGRILIDCRAAPASAPRNLSETCIDGRGAEVAVEWLDPGSCDPTAVWDVWTGSAQYGLMLLNPSVEQRVAAGAVVAGCRYGTDGRTGFQVSRWGLDVLTGATLGPGNVFGLESDAVRVMAGSASTAATVTGNSFGFDPVTRQVLPVRSTLDLRAPTDLVDNTFAVLRDVLDMGQSRITVTLERNRFGTDEYGNPLDGGFSGLETQLGRTVVGPGNTFRSLVTPAITVTAPATDAFAATTITRNHLVGNAGGIVYTSATVAAPALTAVTPGSVSGTCGGEGVVEVFSGGGGQGDTYLGSTACDGGAPWTLTNLAVPAQTELVATFTDPGGRTSAFSPPLPTP